MGDRVGVIAEQLGQPLMPWQQHVADVALEIDPATGRLWYRHVVLTVPRQSGKTTLILAVAIHRALGFGEPQRIVYAAQTRLDARMKLVYDQMPLVAKSPFATSQTPRLASGEEAILWKNGSRHGISSNTEKAGHGGTLDLAFVDEAFAQVDDRLDQAFSPAMITRPQPQAWIVSTAGTVDSTYLNEKVAAGREAADDPTSRMAFFEWSADPDADPADPATWASCMPALGHTVTESAVRAEFESLNLAEFKRAYLNIPTARHLFEPVIDLDLWESLADSASQIVGPLAFAVDITPDRSAAAIAVAGARADGVEHVEVIQHFSGVAGVAERLAELYDRYDEPPIGIDTGSAAGSIIPDLERLEVPFVSLGAKDMTAACGAFYDAVVEKRVRHLSQPPLNAALSSAKKRDLAGAWAWHRRDSGDICPLVAVTLARHVWSTMPDESPFPNVAFR
jgi:phage terminase large subunit-like protein